MPAALIIPAAIGAAASVGSSALQSRAANRSSRAQQDAAREANRIQDEANRRAEEAAREQRDYDRWLQSATTEARRPYLEQATALMGSAGGGYGPARYEAPAPFTAPTQAEAVNDPGYQAQLAEGQRRLEGSAAARGTLNTGGTLKDVQQYGQNMASARYQDVYDRALNAYSLQEQLRGQAYDRQQQADYNAAALAQSASSGRINDLLALAGLAAPGQYPGYQGGAGVTPPAAPSLRERVTGPGWWQIGPNARARGADSGQRRPWLLPPGMGDPLERNHTYA